MPPPDNSEPPPDDPETADPPAGDMNQLLRDAVARRRTPVGAHLFARAKTADDEASDPPPPAA